MIRPWIFSDSPLWLLRVITYTLAALFWLFGDVEQAVRITLTERCCAAETCTVAESLATLPTAGNVVHEAKTGDTVISLRTGPKVTPRMLWETVEEARGKPRRLTVGNREYVAKPLQ